MELRMKTIVCKELALLVEGVLCIVISKFHIVEQRKSAVLVVIQETFKKLVCNLADLLCLPISLWVVGRQHDRLYAKKSDKLPLKMGNKSRLHSDTVPTGSPL